MNTKILIAGIALLLVMPTIVAEGNSNGEADTVVTFTTQTMQNCVLPVGISYGRTMGWKFQHCEKSIPEPVQFLCPGWSVMTPQEYFRRYGVNYGDWTNCQQN